MPKRKLTTKQAFGLKKRRKPRGRQGGRKSSVNIEERIDHFSDETENITLENRFENVPATANFGNMPSTSDFGNVPENVTSVRKHRYFADSGENQQLCSGYRIVSLASLEKLVKSLACPSCGNQDLQLKEMRKGIASDFSVLCDKCDAAVSKINSSDNNKINHTSNINLLTIASAVNNGIGYNKLCSFFSGQNIPRPLHLKTYQDIKINVQNAAELALEEHFMEVSSIIKKEYEAIGQVSDSIVNIAVSYDGSWHKRGHSSMFGLGAVIDLLTGLVLDIAVMSKYCHGCSLAKNDPSKYQQHDCQINFDGSSGAMEVEAALQLFGRSVEKYGLRYLTILSDGDCKTFLKLKEKNIYGDMYAITKEECINHVSKRMGSALRKLKDKSKQSGINMGGRGRLTNEKIEMIQNYYGKALKDNAPDVEKMRNAAYASLFHMVSTDEAPHHTFCPVGRESWCHYNRALQDPSLKRPHKPTLPKDIGEALLPIYKRLSETELLQRCTRNTTQNSNESLHSIIWQKCPKGTFASYKTVKTAAALAAMQYNKGPNAIFSLYSKLQIPIGKYQIDAAVKGLKRKISDAARFSTSEAKLERKTRKIKKLKAKDKHEATEGSVYDPGAF